MKFLVALIVLSVICFSSSSHAVYFLVTFDNKKSVGQVQGEIVVDATDMETALSETESTISKHGICVKSAVEALNKTVYDENLVIEMIDKQTVLIYVLDGKRGNKKVVEEVEESGAKVKEGIK